MADRLRRRKTDLIDQRRESIVSHGVKNLAGRCPCLSAACGEGYLVLAPGRGAVVSFQVVTSPSQPVTGRN
jgi:hypothetical protein